MIQKELAYFIASVLEGDIHEPLENYSAVQNRERSRIVFAWDAMPTTDDEREQAEQIRQARAEWLYQYLGGKL